MADILRARIRESGKTLVEIANAAGVPQPRLTVFMQGKDIRLTTAQKLADHFGLMLKKR